MNKSDNTLKKVVLSAVFAAFITIMTAFICHIPYGAGAGYIHFGDALIYLCAAILPTPYAIFAAAVGAGLADLMTAPVWAVFTVIIKILLVLPMTNKSDKIINRRNIFALIPGCIVTIAGYYLAEAIIYGNFVAPVFSIYGNAIQAAGSVTVFIILGLSLDKSGFKRYCNRELTRK